MLKQHLSRGVGLVGLFVLLTITGAAASAQEASLPTISATAEGITVPEGLVAGLTTLVFRNDTEAPFSPILARLKEGKTMEDFMAAMQAGPAGALAVVVILGGVETAPGGSYNITYNLLAGDYILLSFAQQGPPTILPFSVASSEHQAPQPDVVVNLVDFAFAMPTSLAAGTQVWEIANIGEQPHEMAILRVEESATLEDVSAQLIAALASAENGPPEMPYETAFMWTPMSPGTRAWLEVNLEPGTYVVVCFIPDFTSEEMLTHLQHGMIALITVVE